MIFFPILEAQLQFQAFCGNYDIISRRTQKKNQSSLFSYCHEEQPRQKIYPNSKKKWRKKDFCVKKPIRCAGKGAIWAINRPKANRKQA